MGNNMKLNFAWVHSLTRLRKENMILWMEQWGAHLVALYVGKWNCYNSSANGKTWNAENLLGHNSWKIK
jgi:hypothetical protein